MYGFICEDKDYEWWVRRKEHGKSDIVISQEEYQIMRGQKVKTWVRYHNLDYALSSYCPCPEKVKEIAKELKEKIS